MRHRVQRHQLGVKKEHRQSMMANLAAALFRHGRIQTTLAKAKALRPFAEKIITLAKRAAATDAVPKKLHFRRLAIARVRDKQAVKQLFDERVHEFLEREGGYCRIYKLGARLGDAAEMALIELIDADDEGYSSNKRKSASKKQASAKKEKIAEPSIPEAEIVPPVEAELTEPSPEATASSEEVAEAPAPISEEPTSVEPESAEAELSEAHPSGVESSTDEEASGAEDSSPSSEASPKA